MILYRREGSFYFFESEIVISFFPFINFTKQIDMFSGLLEMASWFFLNVICAHVKHTIYVLF
jgi:hypothetical protein